MLNVAVYCTHAVGAGCKIIKFLLRSASNFFGKIFFGKFIFQAAYCVVAAEAGNSGIGV